MSTALVFVHGRSQQMPRPLRGDRARVDAHVLGLKRRWLAGLAKGLVLAGRGPFPDGQVYFPYYGNLLADLIDARIAQGGAAPDLEIELVSSLATRDQMVLEAARHLGFDAAEELAYTEPQLAEQASRDLAHKAADELDWSATLRLPAVRAALQFLARKTGTAEVLIEDFLTDVAYYLATPEIRERVLDVVQETLATVRAHHEATVLVAHSLGTVVAYDLLGSTDTARPISLLVTAGSPLGLPVVQRNLLGAGTGATPQVPLIDAGREPSWVNAFDVRDVVALIHPLRDCFAGGRTAIRDIITHNPTSPHSVEDYLAERDVAAAVAAAVG
jgi:hypothetical protein